MEGRGRSVCGALPGVDNNIEEKDTQTSAHSGQDRMRRSHM